MESPAALKFIDSYRGKKLILLDGFIFHKSRAHGGNSYFTCSQRNTGCTAGLTLIDFNEENCSYSSYRLKDRAHNHDPSPEGVQSREDKKPKLKPKPKKPSRKGKVVEKDVTNEVKMECPENLTFVESYRGKKLIVVDGFMFHKNRSCGGTSYFTCSQRSTGCTAGLTVIDYDEEQSTYSSFKMKNRSHNHKSSPDEVLKRAFKKPKKVKRSPREVKVVENGVTMNCPEKLNFIESYRGKKLIVIDGFMFHRMRVSGNASYFICSGKPKGCNAGLTVIGFNEENGSYSSFRLKDKPHNHQACPEKVRKRACKPPKQKGFNIINKKTGEVLKDVEVKALEKEVLFQQAKKYSGEEDPQENVKEEMVEDPLEEDFDFTDNRIGVPSPPEEEASLQLQECLICSSLHGTTRFPAYLGRSSTNNTECWLKFFLRGILAISKKDCGKLLGRLCANALNFDYSGWFHICSKCLQSAEKIYTLNKTMLRMEKGILKLQDEIEKKVKTSLGPSPKKIRREDDGEDVARVREKLVVSLNARERQREQQELLKILEDRLGIEGDNTLFSTIQPIHSNARNVCHYEEEDKKPNIFSEAEPEPIPTGQNYEITSPCDDYDFIQHSMEEEDDEDASGGNQEKSEGLRRYSRHSSRRQNVKFKKADIFESEESNSSEFDYNDPAYKPNTESSKSPQTSPNQRNTMKVKSPKQSNNKSVSKMERIILKYKSRTKLLKPPPSKWKQPKKKVQMQCPICPHRFMGNEDRLQHKVDHETLKEFTCPTCNFPSVSETGLKIHMSNKHGSRGVPFWFKCDRCEYITQRQKEKKRHLEMHRINDYVIDIPEGGYSCKLCSQVFRSKGNAHSHLGEKHKDTVGIRTFVCDLCGMFKLSPITLRTHIRMVHQKKRDYPCDECGGRFATKARLEDHKWKHKPVGQNKVMCDICGLEYGNPRYLLDHIKRFHDNPSSSSEKMNKPEKECPYCGLKLIHDKALLLHMKTIHADLLHFECHLCDARFAKAIALKNHTISVHSTGSVKCPNCGSEFKCDEYLKRHLRINCRKNPGNKYSQRIGILGSSSKDEKEAMPLPSPLATFRPPPPLWC